MVLAAADANDTRGTHQTGHALTTDANAFVGKIVENPRRSICAARGQMVVLDPLEDLGVTHRPRRRRPAPPLIVAAQGDAQHTAHRAHGKLGLVRSHEPEPLLRLESLLSVFAA